MLPRDLVDLGAEIMLSNTYHLYLRPGDGLIARHGGLHRFIGWDRPILTDSGGYQAFSLGERRTIDERGICFRSHLDGSEHLLTPEKATDIQANLGSDIAMVLDECLGYPATRDEAAASMERTLRWEARCRQRFLELASGEPAKLGRRRARSGGTAERCRSRAASCSAASSPTPARPSSASSRAGHYRDIRVASAQATVALGFEAYAIGGLSVGEPPEIDVRRRRRTRRRSCPADRPRYLMGTGTPVDLVEVGRPRASTCSTA